MSHHEGTIAAFPGRRNGRQDTHGEDLAAAPAQRMGDGERARVREPETGRRVLSLTTHARRVTASSTVFGSSVVSERGTS